MRQVRVVAKEVQAERENGGLAEMDPEEEKEDAVHALPAILEAEEITRLEGEHLEELEEAFSLFDIDGNGLISLNELTAVMKSVGKDLVDEDIQEMLTLADKDGDGEIGFDDFHDLMKETILRGIQEDDLREAFSVFDADEDGFITPCELHTSFQNLGEVITREQAFELLKEADTNCDGLVDFEEFKTFYKKGLEEKKSGENK